MLNSFGMKQVILPVLAIVVPSLGAPALAGNVSSATITQIVGEGAPIGGTGTGDGAVFVYVSVAPTGSPACATSNLFRFAIDPATPIGMSQIAMVLSAHATGAQVDIVGYGTCGVWSDTETIWYITAH